jgi:hypothetical protein
MRRPLREIVPIVLGFALAMLLLLIAMSALAQDDQWPPPEVTTQAHPPRPDPDRGPMPVRPVGTLPSSASGADPVVCSPAPPAPWSAYDIAKALAALGTAAGIGGGAGVAFHITCRRDQLELSRGPMDWENLRNDIRENTEETRALRAELAAARPLLEGRSAEPLPSLSPPDRKQDRRTPTMIPASAEDPP